MDCQDLDVRPLGRPSARIPVRDEVLDSPVLDCHGQSAGAEVCVSRRGCALPGDERGTDSAAMRSKAVHFGFNLP